jgi:hypothetical protein
MDLGDGNFVASRLRLETKNSDDDISITTAIREIATQKTVTELLFRFFIALRSCRFQYNGNITLGESSIAPRCHLDEADVDVLGSKCVKDTADRDNTLLPCQRMYCVVAFVLR